MLFWVKNYFFWTLAACILFVAGAYAGIHGLKLYVNVQPHLQTVWKIMLGGLAISLSDAALHGLFWITLRGWYRSRYHALVEFFRSQGAKEILAGGLLAAAEEMVFRGFLLEWLIQKTGWPAATAVGVSALVFGLCHLIPTRAMWPFVFWAVWEGVLLGGVYVLSGSLLVAVTVHFLHDVGGFTLFAYQRRPWRKKVG